VRALKEAIEQQLHGSSGRRLALLNLPQQYRGAHMIYNGSMFSVLISPPLSAKDYSNDVATFEPIMFGDSQLVSASRLKRIARSNQYNLFRWDQDHMKLAPLLEPVGANQTLSQSHANPDPNPNTSSGSHANQNQGQVWSNVGTVSSDRAVTLKVPHIAPDRYDFIQITVRAAGPTKNPPVLQISWAQDNDDSVSLKNRTLYQPLSQSTDVQTLAISLAEHKSWIGLNHIDRFSFSLPGRNQQAVIDKISLLPGNDRVPRLEFDLGKRNSAGFKPSEDARGVVWVGGAIGPFSYDISDIPQADHAVYELSKRDFWFGNKMRDQVFAAKETELTERADLKALKSTSQEIKIAENLQPGYYDFRIFAVDNKGEILGYSSDPVNLWIKPSRGHAEKRN
jgi:hypothetical protein